MAEEEDTSPVFTSSHPEERLQWQPLLHSKSLPNGPPPFVRASSSTSSQRSNRSASSRRQNSGRRQPAPVVYNATAREVLFGHYLNMAQERRVVLGYDKPGFLAKLFLFFVCVPTDLCDMRMVTKLLQGLVTRLAHTVVCLGFLLVPLWILMLWLLAVGWTWEQMLSMLPSFEQLKAAAADWQGTSAAFSSWASSVAGGGWRLALSGSLPDLSTPEQWVLLAKRLGPVAVSGLLLFVACDAIDASAAQQEAEKKQGVIKPQHLPPSDPGPSPWTSAKPSSTSSQPRSQVGASANSQAQGIAAGHGSQSVPKASSKRQDTPVVREVRAAVMKLEQEVLGNEIVAAALPAEVLPARVSKLCEEVGVKCGEHPTWEEMPKLLKEVAAAVGMDL